MIRKAAIFQTFQFVLGIGLASCAGSSTPVIVSPSPAPASTVRFENIAISGAGTYGIVVGSAVAGEATFSNVQVSGAAKAGLRNDAPDWHFKLVREAGNSGW